MLTERSPEKNSDVMNALLLTLKRSKTPDIATILKLKTILSSSDRDLLSSFLSESGVEIMLSIMKSKVLTIPKTELDIAVLYEMAGCCKSLMNNSMGMNAFINIEGSIDILTSCLLFDFKVLALLILEILSVCCYYSEDTAALVVKSMR